MISSNIDAQSVMYRVLVIVTLSTSFVQCFELVRGPQDRFTVNESQCEGSVTRTCCQKIGATLLTSSDGRTWCKCGIAGNNTYIPGSVGRDVARCIKDQDIVPESGNPEKAFRIRSTVSQPPNCAIWNNGGSTLQLNYCNINELRMVWLWLNNGNKLLNIGTMQCLAVDKDNIVMERCSVGKVSQKFRCHNSSRKLYDLKYGKEHYPFRLFHSDNYFKQLLQVKSELIFKAVRLRIENSSWLWWNFPQIDDMYKRQCHSSQYKGCYHFDGGSFIQFISKNMCKEDCFTSKIVAPIFAENTRCSVAWKRSRYMGDNGKWLKVNGTKYFGITREKNPRVKINATAIEVWSGVVLKLAITCQSKEQKYKEFREKLCVLLKFETKQEIPLVTSNPPIFTSIPTQPGSRKPTITTTTTQVVEKPGDTHQSSSNTTTAISVAIGVIVLILLAVVVLTIWFIRRRRKRTQGQNTGSRTEPQTQQSQMDGMYTEAPPTYESLVHGKGTSNNALDLYNCINEPQPTSSSNGNEYSRARADGVTKSITNRPLPSAPTNAHNYDTLEQGSENLQHYTDLKQVSDEPKPVYASLGDSGKQVKQDNKADSVPKKGEYRSVGEEIANAALPSDDVYSYATNRQMRSQLSDMLPAMPAIYSTLEGPDANPAGQQQSTQPDYATLEESNPEQNTEEYVTVLEPSDELSV